MGRVKKILSALASPVPLSAALLAGAGKLCSRSGSPLSSGQAIENASDMP
jgi:hypothetical protein